MKMKKFILLGLCLLVFAGGAFAQNLAIGGGALFNNSWTISKGTDIIYWGDETEVNLSRQGFGAFAFFGLGKFVELNFGFMYKNPSKLKVTVTFMGYTATDEEDVSGFIDGTIALQFGAYFKYPFVLSDRLVLFPTAGVDFELTLADAYEGWWDDLWIRGGLGLDVFVTRNAFIRVHALYGFGIVAGSDTVWDWLGMDSAFSHGLLLKVGVGFMF